MKKIQSLSHTFKFNLGPVNKSLSLFNSLSFFSFSYFNHFHILSTSSKPLSLPISLRVCLPIPYSKSQGMAGCYGNSLLGNLLVWRRAHRLPGQCCQWQQSAVPAVCVWMCIDNVFILFVYICKLYVLSKYAFNDGFAAIKNDAEKNIHN